MKAKEKLLKSKDVAWILDWSPDDVNVLAIQTKRGPAGGAIIR